MHDDRIFRTKYTAYFQGIKDLEIAKKDMIEKFEFDTICEEGIFFSYFGIRDSRRLSFIHTQIRRYIWLRFLLIGYPVVGD